MPMIRFHLDDVCTVEYTAKAVKLGANLKFNKTIT